jgi:hypothetical protein
MADVTFNAFAGINNNLPAERIRGVPTKDNPTCELVAGVNVDIDDSGQIRRRPGQVTKVAGAVHSLWASQDNCLFIAGTSLKRLNPDFSATTLANGLTADAVAAYVEVNDRIYWTNGVQTGVVSAAGNRTWGMEAADSPTLAAIAGQMGAGLYQAAITFVRGDGQESGAGMTSQITLTADQGVRLTWTAPTDPAIVEVNLYLSEPDGMILYQAAAVTAVAGTADVTNPTLALPLNTQWNDAPPAGAHLAYHNGRIFIAEGAFVFGTTALGYEYVDLRDYLALDGTSIGFLVGVPGGLYIGTAKAVYFAGGDRLENFTRRTLVESSAITGSAVLADGFAVTGRAEMDGHQVVLFATAAGIHMGTEDGAITNLTQNRYALPAMGASAALFRDPHTIQQYQLFPAGVVVNTHTNAVTTYAGISANSACMFNGIALLATDAGIVALQGDTDLGAPIAASVTGGVTDFGDEHIKRVLTGIAGYRADGDVELTLTADGHHEAVYRLLPRRIGEQHATRVKFGRGAKGRYWQWRLTNRDGAGFALDSLALDVQPLGRKLA